MSYDIHIIDKKTKNIIKLSKTHYIAGGTYAVGGTKDCSLNITYNYQPIFAKLFGENGIRSIYGRDIYETRNEIADAMKWLKDDVDNDYWKCTEGNVKHALCSLVDIADLAIAEFPETEMVWSGD